MYISLILASLGIAASVYKHFDCGTNITHASDHFLQTSKQLHQSKAKGAPGGKDRYHYKRQSSPISVDTYFHIVTKTDPTSVSSVTQDMATNQIQALNKAYSAYNINFNLLNTSFTANDVWAVGAATADDLAMKNALRQGTYASLNIYFQTDLSGDILGQCTLPSQITGTVPPSAYANDGCNVNANTMPGGNIDMYNEGQTAVHETGHWLGLMHVFEGNSCTGDGDLIADTPAQSTSTDGCPTSPPKDSCPDQPGVDSIHNIMDYSFDSCYQGFTDDQAQRMQTLWPMYRSGH
ncbi:zincin [Rhizodiscina lignyota]|uniref:Zincin n=1 Tax=Rhizodiscina lignyota TaxID=1504668 RepID=A0A9P4IDR4_9PEZI|nr:zincin [Rhizodiscina lignyota]